MDLIEDVDAEDDFEKADGEDCLGLLNLETVTDVLKYSRTWVIIPSVTVQACTQEIERSRSQPSTSTVDSKEVMERGANRNEDESSSEAPVRRRIKNWWDGGPWNHHSRSGARIW